MGSGPSGECCGKSRESDHLSPLASVDARGLTEEELLALNQRLARGTEQGCRAAGMIG